MGMRKKNRNKWKAERKVQLANIAKQRLKKKKKTVAKKTVVKQAT